MKFWDEVIIRQELATELSGVDHFIDNYDTDYLLTQLKKFADQL